MSPSLRTAYARGRAFEYRVQRELAAIAGAVFRSAGSHSPVDLIWCARDFIAPRAVQCKTEGAEMGPKARKAYYDFCAALGLVPLVATRKRGGFRLDRVLKDGAVVTMIGD